MDNVFEFSYCSDVSMYGMQSISLHRTRKGAENAIEAHKLEAKKEYDLYSEYRKKRFNREPTLKFGEFELWEVVEREIKD